MRVVSHRKIRDFGIMNNISDQQYQYALERIEELLPLVDDNTPKNDKNAVELSLMGEIVIAYENIHYPMTKHEYVLEQGQQAVF